MQFSSVMGVNSWETAANSYTQCILPQMNCKTFVIYYQKTRKDAQKLSPLLQKTTLTVLLVCPGDEHELNVCCTCCIYRGPNNTWRMEPMNLPLTPGIQTNLERFVESWGWMVWFSSFTYMNGRWFWAGGRLWPQVLVACDHNFWSLVTAWTVMVSLFLAGGNIWSCWGVTSGGKRIIWWCWRVNFCGRRSIWWNLASTE